MARFQDRIVLVTGGTSGIGLACSEKFAREGARVILIGRNESRGRAVVSRIKELGSFAEFFQADLSNRTQLHEVFDRVGQRIGRLDIAINSAGMEGSSFTKLTDYPEETWDAVLALNLTSVWLCMKHELAMMGEHRKGSIVNVASIAGLRASYSGGCAYTASKHGLVGLTKSAAREFANTSIRINAVCPGIVRTAMAIQVLGDKLEQAASLHPIGRLCEPEEVASAITWLSSSEASFLTGFGGGGVTLRSKVGQNFLRCMNLKTPRY